ncbi:nucleoside deaminase [Sulfobacillus thermosulfidooxidans]|uniref:nucleoside deaminase n=1 Tax=Sulfobacillus thermosulfidooxidans TaxID=28034 RepID=UPI00041813AF|nr:nucleoside deaminase [Sulfobacillus thermosulfidooxidans]
MTPDNTSLDTFRLQQHRYFLLMAFEEAEKSLLAGTFPIGAIIVDDDGQVVGRGHNQVFSAEDSTAHAEMEALRDARPLRVDAAKKRYLPRSHTLYTTAEPCLMCAGAIIMSNIRQVVWAANDPANGAIRLFKTLSWPDTAHHILHKVQRLEVIASPFADLSARQIELMKTWNASRGRPGDVWTMKSEPWRPS